MASSWGCDGGGGDVGDGSLNRWAMLMGCNEDSGGIVLRRKKVSQFWKKKRKVETRMRGVCQRGGCLRKRGEGGKLIEQGNVFPHVFFLLSVWRDRKKSYQNQRRRKSMQEKQTLEIHRKKGENGGKMWDAFCSEEKEEKKNKIKKTNNPTWMIPRNLRCGLRVSFPQ